MGTSRWQCLGVALIALTLAGPANAGASEASSAAPPVSSVPILLRAPDATADRARYAGREARSVGLDKYQGGDGGTGIYIGVGSGAVVIILLVIILLIVL